MKIFPVPDDSNNKWVSQQEVSQIKFQGVDSLYVNNVLPLYFASMRQGKLSGDLSKQNRYKNSKTFKLIKGGNYV